MQFSIDVVRDVARLLRETGLREITIKNLDDATGEQFRVSVRRHLPTATRRTAKPAAPTSAASPASAGAATPAVSDAAPALAPSSLLVTATAVGLFRPAEPAIVVGQKVRAGQVVGIVESLKIPNEILAPAAGTVLEVHAEENQGVEYGQPLLTLAPEASSTAESAS